MTCLWETLSVLRVDKKVENGFGRNGKAYKYIYMLHVAEVLLIDARGKLCLC